MENDRISRWFAGSVGAQVLLLCLGSTAWATPPIADQARVVAVTYDSGDWLRATCDSSNQCDFTIGIFGKTFKLTKSVLRSVGPIFPNYLALTPLYPSESTYAVEFEVACSKEEEARWLALQKTRKIGYLRCNVSITVDGDRIKEIVRDPQDRFSFD